MGSLTPSSPAPEPVRAEGTKTGHENAEGMAGFCVRVQRTVRLRRGVEGLRWEHDLHLWVLHLMCQSTRDLWHSAACAGCCAPS